MSYIYITDRTSLEKIKDKEDMEVCNVGSEDYYYDDIVKIYSNEELKLPTKI